MPPHTTRLPLGGFAVLFVPLLAMTRCASSSATTLPSIVEHLCDRDEACPPPVSTCDSPTLASFWSAKCVEGHCQSQEVLVSCPCFDGGCQSSTTSDGGINVVVPEAAAGSTGDDAAPDHAIVPAPDGGGCSGEDAGICEVPQSVCADDRWLAYFTNVTCVAGQCRLDVAYRDCGGRSTCADHGCVRNFTR